MGGVLLPVPAELTTQEQVPRPSPRCNCLDKLAAGYRGVGHRWWGHEQWGLDWSVRRSGSKVKQCVNFACFPGLYEGTENDTGACVSSMLVMGTPTGSAVLTAPVVPPLCGAPKPLTAEFPKVPGQYHFRYFFATGLAAAISTTVY